MGAKSDARDVLDALETCGVMQRVHPSLLAAWRDLAEGLKCQHPFYVIDDETNTLECVACGEMMESQGPPDTEDTVEA